MEHHFSTHVDTVTFAEVMQEILTIEARPDAPAEAHIFAGNALLKADHPVYKDIKCIVEIILDNQNNHTHTVRYSIYHTALQQEISYFSSKHTYRCIDDLNKATNVLARDIRRLTQGTLELPSEQDVIHCSRINKEWIASTGCRMELHCPDETWKASIVNRDNVVIVDHLNVEVTGHTVAMFIRSVQQAFDRGVTEGKLRATETMMGNMVNGLFTGHAASALRNASTRNHQAMMHGNWRKEEVDAMGTSHRY